MAPQRPPDWMRPLPVRLGLVVVPVVWAVVEVVTGDTQWAVMVGAVALWGAWTLVFKYEPAPVSLVAGPPEDPDARTR